MYCRRQPRPSQMGRSESQKEALDFHPTGDRFLGLLLSQAGRAKSGRSDEDFPADRAARHVAEVNEAVKGAPYGPRVASDTRSQFGHCARPRGEQLQTKNCAIHVNRADGFHESGVRGIRRSRRRSANTSETLGQQPAVDLVQTKPQRAKRDRFIAQS
jgi:hypothetical protein